MSTGTEPQSGRKLLIVDDNELNREILSSILEDDFGILTAGNGREALDTLSGRRKEIAAVLLDIYMPICTGFEFLDAVRKDNRLSSIPVIVTTASNAQEDELRCLELGATDFVTKPYNPAVVRGRVRSILKLVDSIATLNDVEHDSLTGLYTLQAFRHYAAERLESDPGTGFDLAVIDLKEFKLINDLFGEKRADEALAFIARKLLPGSTQALAAREGDKFYLFWPSAVREETLCLLNRLEELNREAPVTGLKFKVGFYPDVDRTQPVSSLCDRALIAVKSVKNSYTRSVGTYDDALRRQMLNDQRMESRFHGALEAGEFDIWYQPKVDVRTGRIAAAEALVRWHPKNGPVISPGVFIPLFERDGLIAELDEQVFTDVCCFLKERREQGKKLLPVSINLSRSSLYRPGVIGRYTAIAANFGMPMELIPLELTESATLEGGDILRLTTEFREAGFLLHMDDFGTGYSSLSSLTTLPFSVLKLDKSLIDHIGQAKGDTIVQSMIGIARQLGMEVVAEGVETAQQVEFLRNARCDLIQGYWYSRPKNRADFEAMLDDPDSPLAPR